MMSRTAGLCVKGIAGRGLTLAKAVAKREIVDANLGIGPADASPSDQWMSPSHVNGCRAIAERALARSTQEEQTG